jgi:hypothetical protein
MPDKRHAHCNDACAQDMDVHFVVQKQCAVLCGNTTPAEQQVPTHSGSDERHLQWFHRIKRTPTSDRTREHIRPPLRTTSLGLAVAPKSFVEERPAVPAAEASSPARSRIDGGHHARYRMRWPRHVHRRTLARTNAVVHRVGGHVGTHVGERGSRPEAAVDVCGRVDLRESRRVGGGVRAEERDQFRGIFAGGAGGGTRRRPGRKVSGPERGALLEGEGAQVFGIGGAALEARAPAAAVGPDALEARAPPPDEAPRVRKWSRRVHVREAAASRPFAIACRLSRYEWHGTKCHRDRRATGGLSGWQFAAGGLLPQGFALFSSSRAATVEGRW